MKIQREVSMKRSRRGAISPTFLAQREIFEGLGREKVPEATTSLRSTMLVARNRLLQVLRGRLVRKISFKGMWASEDAVLVALTELQLRALETMVEALLLEDTPTKLLLPRGAQRWRSLSREPFSRCKPRFLSRPWVIRGLQEEPRLILNRVLRTLDRENSISTAQKPVAHTLGQQLNNLFDIRARIRESRPRLIVTGRPTGPAAAFALAGYLEQVPTVFVSHTVVRKNFYDLAPYSHACVITPNCRKMLREKNPDLEFLVTGALTRETQMTEDQGSRDPKLTVGYLATHLEAIQLTEIHILAQVLADLPVRLQIKCHPNHPNKESAKKAAMSHSEEDVEVFAHDEKSLNDFLRDSDVIVTEKSNSAFDAAISGVPTIFWWSRTGAKASEEYSVDVGDVALWAPSDSQELRSIFLQIISQRQRGEFGQLKEEQSWIASSFFPRVADSDIRDFIHRLLSGPPGQKTDLNTRAFLNEAPRPHWVV